MNRNQQFNHIVQIIRIFYLYCCITTFIVMQKLAEFLMTRQDEMYNQTAKILFWWVQFTGTDLGCILIFISALIFSLLAACFVGSRIIRIIQAFFFLNVTWWWWLFVVDKHDADKFAITLAAITLSLIPNFRTCNFTRINREHVISGFVGGQAAILLCYTMAGISKLRFTIFGDLSGGYGVLYPNAMAIRILTHIKDGYYSPELSPLAHFMGTNPIITWGGTLFFFILQITSLFILFKPFLHKYYGMGLIIMHCSICLFFNIHYFDNIFLAYMFLVLSPFGYQKAAIIQRKKFYMLFNRSKRV
jgi:hypothetical protein